MEQSTFKEETRNSGERTADAATAVKTTANDAPESRKIGGAEHLLDPLANATRNEGGQAAYVAHCLEMSTLASVDPYPDHGQEYGVNLVVCVTNKEDESVP